MRPTSGQHRVRWLPVALGTALVASAAAGRDISFTDARAAAVRGALDVQLAERRLPVAAAEVDAAGAFGNPTLSVSTASQTARLGTSLSVPLPLFGQRSRAVAAAQADQESVRLDVELIRREARWAATVAWIDLWEGQARAGLLERAAGAAERVQDIASQRLDAGTGPRVDVLRTRADRGRARAEAEAAAGLVRAAAARLAPWVGEPAEAELSAAGPLAYPADALQHWVADAGVPHPLLARDQAQVEASARHIELEQRLRWPVVSPQVGINAFDPTLPGPDVSVGLSLELPVLNLRSGAIARAQAQRDLAQATATADGRRLEAQLAEAAARTRSAALRLRALRDEVLPAIDEARAMTEDAYRAGRVDLLRLLEAQRALVDTQLAEVEASAAWGRALAEVERASGADAP